MNLTEKNIATLYKLQDELDELIEEESKAYKKATDNRDNKITIKRNGKKVEVKEGDLWDEVRALGLDSEAGKVLQKKYKKAFRVAIKRQKVSDRLNAFIEHEFGTSFATMTAGKLFQTIRELVKYEIENQK